MDIFEGRTIRVTLCFVVEVPWLCIWRTHCWFNGDGERYLRRPEARKVRPSNAHTLHGPQSPRRSRSVCPQKPGSIMHVISDERKKEEAIVCKLEAGGSFNKDVEHDISTRMGREVGAKNTPIWRAVHPCIAPDMPLLPAHTSPHTTRPFHQVWAWSNMTQKVKDRWRERLHAPGSMARRNS